jgi:hypothetical protein
MPIFRRLPLPVMIEVIERYENEHFNYIDLVRALENCAGYESFVPEAVKRHPTPLVITALHRMPDREDARALLRQTAASPQTSTTIKQLIEDLLHARPLEQIIADFDAFTPTPDLNFAGRQLLWDLCHELLNTPTPERAIPAILDVIERYPEVDFDVPGILVHTLEAIGGYENALLESVQRVPAYLSLVMIRRIIYGLEQAGKSAAKYRAVLASVSPDELDF